MLDTYTREHVGQLSLLAPITVERSETLRAAAELLFARDIGLLLVTDTAAPIGVLTERDVVAALASHIDPDRTAVGDLVTGRIIAAEATDTLLDAAGRMVDLGIRHLLVRRDRHYVGVLSIRDVLPAILLQALGLHPSDE
jgi:CBS domain-containing protein